MVHLVRMRGAAQGGVVVLVALLVSAADPASAGAGGAAFEPEVDGALSVRTPAHPRLSPDGTRVAAVVDLTEGDRRRRRLFVAPADALATGALGLELDAASGAPAWSPDGRRLAVTVRIGDRPQIAIVDPDRPGRATPLTRLPTGARDPIWSPDGALVVFESRVFPHCPTLGCQTEQLAASGSSPARVYEQEAPRRWTRWRDGRARHLFAKRLDGGPAWDLTPHPHPPVAEPTGPEPRWAFWGTRGVVYVSEAPPASGEARAVDTDLHLVDLEPGGGTPVRLTESAGRDHAPTPGPTGRLLYLAGPAPGAERGQVTARILEPDATEARTLGPAPDLPIRAAAPFGPGALLVVDRTGHRPLVFAPLGGGAWVDRIGAGTVDAVHAAGSRIVVVASRFDAPPELVVLGPDGRPLGRSRLNRRTPRPAIAVREVRTRRTSGVEVHGFLVHPEGEPVARPTVVLLHGGPESAWTDGWHPRWNAATFASAGFTVLLPNLAGSVGYGRRFRDRVQESWGGAPFGDLERFAEAAEAWPEVGAPIALAGASFGGYLVAWSLARSDRYACGVSHAGVFDPAALWGETDARWFPEWEFGGPPWAPGAVYDRWSPARYAHRIRAPMLLTHGDRDYRVPVEQSLRLYSTLQRRGLPARLLHFPDEGHFIRSPGAKRAWLEATLGFLRGCLGREPTALREDRGRARTSDDGRVEDRASEGRASDRRGADGRASDRREGDRRTSDQRGGDGRGRDDGAGGGEVRGGIDRLR